jgi:hypothetical protein
VSYAITVTPSTIAKGETAVATVTLPQVEDVVHDVEVFRRGSDERVASASVTVHAEQLTVGTQADGSTDYYVTADGLEVVQTGPYEFDIRA